MKHHLIAIFISLIATIGIYYLHITYPSMLNYSKANTIVNHPENRHGKNDEGVNVEYLSFVVDYHYKEDHAFARRPMTSLAIKAFSKITGMDQAKGFAVINFLLLIFCGWSLFLFARSMGVTPIEGYLSLLLFYTNFTILFSFFGGIYSYDEPLQYSLLFLSFWAIFTKRWWVAGIMFTVALIARESAVFLLPGTLLFIIPYIRNQPIRLNWQFIKPGLLAAIPVVIYGAFVFWYIKEIGVFEKTLNYIGTERLTGWAFNFQDDQYKWETWVSIIVATLPAVYLLIYYHAKNKVSLLEKRIALAFAITFLINLPIALITTQAREARIIAFPLMLIWPLLGRYLWNLLQNWTVGSYNISLKSWGPHLVNTGAHLALGYWVYYIAQHHYQPTNYDSWHAGFKVYFQLTCWFVLGLNWYWMRSFYLPKE